MTIGFLEVSQDNETGQMVARFQHEYESDDEDYEIAVHEIPVQEIKVNRFHQQFITERCGRDVLTRIMESPDRGPGADKSSTDSPSEHVFSTAEEPQSPMPGAWPEPADEGHEPEEKTEVRSPQRVHFAENEPFPEMETPRRTGRISYSDRIENRRRALASERRQRDRTNYGGWSRYMEQQALPADQRHSLESLAETIQNAVCGAQEALATDPLRPVSRRTSPQVQAMQTQFIQSAVRHEQEASASDPLRGPRQPSSLGKQTQTPQREAGEEAPQPSLTLGGGSVSDLGGEEPALSLHERERSSSSERGSSHIEVIPEREVSRGRSRQPRPVPTESRDVVTRGRSPQPRPVPTESQDTVITIRSKHPDRERETHSQRSAPLVSHEQDTPTERIYESIESPEEEEVSSEDQTRRQREQAPSPSPVRAGSELKEETKPAMELRTESSRKPSRESESQKERQDKGKSPHVKHDTPKRTIDRRHPLRSPSTPPKTMERGHPLRSYSPSYAPSGTSSGSKEEAKPELSPRTESSRKPSVESELRIEAKDKGKSPQTGREAPKKTVRIEHHPPRRYSSPRAPSSIGSGQSLRKAFPESKTRMEVKGKGKASQAESERTTVERHPLKHYMPSYGDLQIERATKAEARGKDDSRRRLAKPAQAESLIGKMGHRRPEREVQPADELDSDDLPTMEEEARIRNDAIRLARLTVERQQVPFDPDQLQHPPLRSGNRGRSETRQAPNTGPESHITVDGKFTPITFPG